MEPTQQQRVLRRHRRHRRHHAEACCYTPTRRCPPAGRWGVASSATHPPRCGQRRVARVQPHRRRHRRRRIRRLRRRLTRWRITRNAWRKASIGLRILHRRL